MLLAELTERFIEHGFDKSQIIRRRGLPWNQQNGFIAGFNGSFRRGVPRHACPRNLAEVREQAEDWH